MRDTYIVLLFILSGFWLELQAQSQIEIANLDSVPIVKPKIHEELFQFIDYGLKEIQYSNVDNILTEDGSKDGLSSLSSAVLTEITGLGSSSGREGFWNVSGSIQCNDTLPVWQVNLYCKGYMQKDRERTRNDDGSVSLHTTRTNVYYWNKEATGVILGSTETVGSFKIIIGIPEDELVDKWHGFIFDNHASPKNMSRTEPYFSYGASYEIRGKFHGKNFVLIQNGTNRRVWIFFDELLAGIFQGDIDYSGVKKKSRNQPYLMINKAIPSAGRRYIFRLAIISRFMNNYMDLYRF